MQEEEITMDDTTLANWARARIDLDVAAIADQAKLAGLLDDDDTTSHGIRPSGIVVVRNERTGDVLALSPHAGLVRATEDGTEQRFIDGVLLHEQPPA